MEVLTRRDEIVVLESRVQLTKYVSSSCFSFFLSSGQISLKKITKLTVLFIEDR